jgi:HEPN domain-containing protein
MNSRDEMEYRLKLAEGYLSKAEGDAADEQWDDCLANSQEAVENAGKAILSLYRPVPKRHDTFEPLEDLLDREEVSESIKKKIRDDLIAFLDMGHATHLRVTYGDEEKHTPPWELIEKPESMKGLEKARRAVTVAKSIYEELNADDSNAETQKDVDT